MVDNTQTAEDFAFTRMPTIDAAVSYKRISRTRLAGTQEYSAKGKVHPARYRRWRSLSARILAHVQCF